MHEPVVPYARLADWMFRLRSIDRAARPAVAPTFAAATVGRPAASMPDRFRVRVGRNFAFAYDRAPSVDTARPSTALAFLVFSLAFQRHGADGGGAEIVWANAHGSFRSASMLAAAVRVPWIARRIAARVRGPGTAINPTVSVCRFV
jgi:hypothetical protein